MAGVLLTSGGSVHHPALATVLVAIAVLAYLAERYALPTWQIDTSFAVALIALVYCGPLVTFVAAAAAEPLRRLLEQRRGAPPRPIAQVATVASFAWYTTAAYVLLGVLPGAHSPDVATRWPAYAVACSAMAIINVTLVWGVLHRLVDHQPWTPVARIISSMLPLAFLAAVVASLYALVGLPALAVFAAIACLPGVFIRLAAPILAPKAAALDRGQAAERYAVAIATRMGIGRRRRRVIRMACGWTPPTYPLALLARRFQDHDNARRVRFDLDISRRHGRPDWLPEETCVLELADAWAALTAAGTLELSHTAALAALEADPARFSTAALRAAWQVVDDQPIAAREDGIAPLSSPLARRLTALAAS
jgi:hypothetical protein